MSVFTDEQQIEHVTSKVSMVETMHDGLRLALEGLRRDVKDGKTGAISLKQSIACKRSHKCNACSGHVPQQAQ